MKQKRKKGYQLYRKMAGEPRFYLVTICTKEETEFAIKNFPPTPFHITATFKLLGIIKEVKEGELDTEFYKWKLLVILNHERKIKLKLI